MPIFITGGTGFVGSAIVTALGDRPLRLLVRDRTKATKIVAPNIELVEGDVTKPGTLPDAIRGCDTIIHLVAIIQERGGATFDGVIRLGTVNVVNAASELGVRRFIFMSALAACDRPGFGYMQAKWRAEEAVKAADFDWTLFRPSVIFGPGDGFVNALADGVRSFPITPVVGNGQTKFQPVSVKDVADAFVAAVDDPSTVGQTFEMGGPDILTYEQMLDIIAAKLGKSKRKVHMPVGLMRTVVSLSSPLPKALRPPVTSEQLKMLALDNSTGNSATEKLIGRPPLRLQDGIDYILEC
jgi:NADH dehydrogenase